MTQTIRTQTSSLKGDLKQLKKNHSVYQGIFTNALIGSMSSLVFFAQNADARHQAFCNHLLPCGQEIAQQPFGVITPSPGGKPSVGGARTEETSNGMIIP
ncbi:MAG: hypothetical protein ACKO45_07110, partial [Cyanobium sp.]